MSIYKSAVDKPVTTFMIFIAIMVMGAFSLINIPIDLYPEMEPPYVSVMTTYSGANAADIETNVTKVLEDALNSVDKLKEISSTSSDNISVISLEFEWDANLDEATNDIRDVIDRMLDNLPDGVDRPTIFKFNTSMFPILFYAITAEETYPGLEKLIDEKVINPLNRVDGVGSVAMVGTPQRMVYVDVDPKRLDAYDLTLEQIGSIISGENQNLPLGNVKMGKIDYQLRVQGEFSESERINNLVVANRDGKQVYVRDIATVRDTLKDVTLEERINGEEGVRLFVMKQSGANTVKVARQIKDRLEELKTTLPPDVKIQEIFDSSTFIKGSISNLSSTLMYAMIFVVFVVLFFLGRWRATFIIVLTIPISLIVSFVYLYLTGNSLNVISLTSLSIAIGMVVDDTIVVLENITRHVERGSSPREAAIYATNEVWLSVIVTTLVVVAVFFPLTLVSGMTGVLFNQLGWIVTITVVTSTVAAISLTPMLASRLLKLSKKKKPRRFSWENTVEKWLVKLDEMYERLLRRLLHYKSVVIIGTFLVFFASLFLTKFIGSDFMPESDESQITANVELQTGLRVEETSKVTRQLEAIIKERYPEVELISSSSGADDEGGFISMFSTTGSNIINFTLRLSEIDERQRTVWEIADDFRAQIALLPEVVSSTVSTSSQGLGGSGNTVDFEIYGYNFDVTNRYAEQVLERLRKLEGAQDVTISRKNDKPELQIVLDRTKLSEHGLTSAQVSMFVRNRVNGLIPSYYKEEGEEYDIKIRLEEDYRNSISDLQEMTIMTATGKKVKLKELGTIEEYWSPPSIEHKRRERLVTISATPSGISLGELANRIKTETAAIDTPPEIVIAVGGAYEDQQESFMDLAMLFGLSLILVFIVMASQFESLRMPLIIMMSIPFAFTGVILALVLTGTTLSVVAALGAVLLVGIVVKNGIVLVDFINLMRDRGMDLYEAIALSGKSRLRPVLMTAATTILGMLPLAMSTGEGAEIWRPMGITVIGGLIFSTLVTMVIVPVMYAVLASKGERRKQDEVRKQFVFMDE
ncbi:efflux RND transporter permease subunit [Sunxiuqinia elliptica]|uniref:HAE1 family hydrophobic/amphiphilic exporter-1 n=1 Tax=Sunxiuqinia elliptica TaxID=655355 RepID=A0A4R6HAY1_9BACT|nr:efflux RND transporter permease subunit [Sunxiuqinia elliptica]TDO04795.1 HAE1 family hydrophobic/amphiphilic exporter-1 [Sunxiuqinia elliptica]TDO64342.1 HAE1 family hydrophobic/amphiphilic exporter-1 [Sunxiuqinia elliptica]